MKHPLLQSFIEDSLERMFISDKHGQQMFFPWGDQKPGYLINGNSLAKRVKKFYKSSFIVYLVMVVIGASVFQSFWGILGSIILCSGGWYVTHHLYISRIVKSLPIAKASYRDVVLEKFEPDDAEESPESD